MPDEKVNHPQHYGGDTTYETIKVIEAWELGFCLGNAVKYISRAGKKPDTNTLDDLKKAVWYLNREVERIEKLKGLVSELVSRSVEPTPLKGSLDPGDMLIWWVGRSGEQVEVVSREEYDKTLNKLAGAPRKLENIIFTKNLQTGRIYYNEESRVRERCTRAGTKE